MSIPHPPQPSTIHLTLISHTNVGKTTLLRTLLRRDAGEVADRAHVTSSAQGHVLVDTSEGDELRLWDTPGFGDSSRLFRRLRMSANPIGWFMTHVWDRFTDRPFFNSQIAVRTVLERSDVVLYLVNAAEDAASAAYVDLELQILGWTGKPVLVLLNQIGAPRPHDEEALDEAVWRRKIASYHGVRGPVSMDAFARCWVQEDSLLGTLGGVLPPDKQPAFERIRATWRARNLEVFDESMLALAVQLAAAASDREAVSAPGFTAKLRRWLASWRAGKHVPEPHVEQAMNALAHRLALAVGETTDRLIALHGLSGRSETVILSRLAGGDVLKEPADPAASGVIGGLVTGAAAGLAADLAAGGLTLGVGALIGGFVGALGGAGAAHAYNLARDADNVQVGWSRDFMAQRVRAALLRYLAVAHYGRGRGDWTEGEYPPHWPQVVDKVARLYQDAVESVWIFARADNDRDDITARLQPVMSAMTRDVLVQLYPACKGIFERQDTR
jgi:hypothetical protein